MHQGTEFVLTSYILIILTLFGECLNLCVILILFCLFALKDICGIMCAALTWLLILYAEFVVMVVMLIPSPYPVYSTINGVVFQSLAFLAFASHLRTMFTDPVREDITFYSHFCLILFLLD